MAAHADTSDSNRAAQIAVATAELAASRGGLEISECRQGWSCWNGNVAGVALFCCYHVEPIYAW